MTVRYVAYECDDPAALPMEDLAATLYAEHRPQARPDVELVADSDALLQAAKSGGLARMWAKYTAGPRKGERVLVLATVARRRLANGGVAVQMRPVAEILQHDPFQTLAADGDVNPPEDAPRIIVPAHIRS